METLTGWPTKYLIRMSCKGFFFFFLRFYLFIYERHRDRETETQAEGEAGSLWGAGCGTQSWIPGSSPEPKADAQPLSHPGAPKSF